MQASWRRVDGFGTVYGEPYPELLQRAELIHALDAHLYESLPGRNVRVAFQGLSSPHYRAAFSTIGDPERTVTDFWRSFN